MKVTKAVITAASPKQRALPLQRLIDRDGKEKPLLSILVEEVLRAQIEEICVVVCPGDEARYAPLVRNQAGRVSFVPQPEPLGYGHALYCAREFTGSDPFLHMVSDHLYIGSSGKGCAQNLVEVAEAEGCAVSAVQPTRENFLPQFGAVGGRRVAGRQDLYRVETVLEKPTPTEAEQRLVVAGLRAGHYLCFFGMHVLTPTIMVILEKVHAEGARGLLTLSDALAELARREQYLALEQRGRRHDVGARYGLLMAQLDLALSGQDRDEVLVHLLELLGLRQSVATD